METTEYTSPLHVMTSAQRAAQCQRLAQAYYQAQSITWDLLERGSQVLLGMMRKDTLDAIIACAVMRLSLEKLMLEWRHLTNQASHWYAMARVTMEIE